MKRVAVPTTGLVCGVLIAVLAGCGGLATQQQAGESAQSGAEPVGATVKVAHLPPTSKDIIAALVDSASVPLSVDPSCGGAGTELEDKTLGRYFSGFLAELNDAEATNAIETSTEEVVLPDGEKVWECRVMIRHAKGEDIWRWGVQYLVRQSDGGVVPDSYRCLGSG